MNDLFDHKTQVEITYTQDREIESEATQSIERKLSAHHNSGSESVSPQLTGRDLKVFFDDVLISGNEVHSRTTMASLLRLRTAFCELGDAVLRAIRRI